MVMPMSMLLPMKLFFRNPIQNRRPEMVIVCYEVEELIEMLEEESSR